MIFNSSPRKGRHIQQVCQNIATATTYNHGQYNEGLRAVNGAMKNFVRRHERRL